MDVVEIYTDGGCEPNPGPGGYGVVLLHPRKRLEASGGFRLTTNNRMELLGAIRGLELLKKPCQARLYCDSKYVVNAIQLGWAKKWRKKDWWRTSQERAENHDLWARLLALCETHQVEFVWVKGHAGIVENERCDQLSGAALRAGNLETDAGYENRAKNAEVRRKPRAGEPCWHCGTAVVKQTRKPKAGQEYFNEYYFVCPQCRATYEVEEARAKVEKPPSLFGD